MNIHSVRKCGGKQVLIVAEVRFQEIMCHSEESENNEATWRRRSTRGSSHD